MKKNTATPVYNPDIEEILRSDCSAEEKISRFLRLWRVYLNIKPKEVGQIITAAKYVVTTADKPELMVRVFVSEIALLINMYDMKKARRLIKRTLVEARQFGDEESFARAKNMQGIMENSLGNMKAAIVCFKEALAFSGARKEYHTQIAILNNIATSYIRLAEWENALMFLWKAEEVLKILRNIPQEHLDKDEQRNNRLKENTRAGYIANNLAMVYYRIGNYETAQEHFYRAYRLRTEAQHRSGMAFSLANVAMCYLKTERVEQAAELIEELLQFCQDITLEPDRRSQVYSIVCGVYCKVASFSKALSVCSLIEEIASSSPSPYINGTYLLSKATVAHYSGDYSSALSFYHTAAEVTISLNNRFELIAIYQSLSDCYEAVGDYQNAFYYHKLAYQYESSALNTQRLQAIGEETAQQKSAREHEKLIHDMTETSLQLARQTQTMERLQELIKRNLRNKKESRTALLLTLMKELQTARASTEKTSEMKTMHSQFVHDLLRKAPSLTNTELKVCALLRLGLSSKEIAGRLFVSVHTVATHRTSIRKKIGLERDAGIVGFLLSF